MGLKPFRLIRGPRRRTRDGSCETVHVHPAPHGARRDESDGPEPVDKAAADRRIRLLRRSIGVTTACWLAIAAILSVLPALFSVGDQSPADANHLAAVWLDIWWRPNHPDQVVDFGAMALAIAGVAITLFLATSLGEKVTSLEVGAAREAAVARLVTADSVIRAIYLGGATLAWLLCLLVAPILSHPDWRGLASLILACCVACALLCVALAELNTETVHTMSYRTAVGEEIEERLRDLRRDLDVSPAEGRVEALWYGALGPLIFSVPGALLIGVLSLRSGPPPWEAWALVVTPPLFRLITESLDRERIIDRARGGSASWVGLVLWEGVLGAAIVLALISTWTGGSSDWKWRLFATALIVLLLGSAIVPAGTRRFVHSKKLLARGAARQLTWIQQNRAT